MGKKENWRQKRKQGDNKALEPDTRTTTVHLHKRLHKATFKRKAPKAVKEIKEYARRTMFTRDVRIDPELNQELWRNGVRNVDRRVDVVMERRKNEDDEESKEKMYTLVKLAK
jgi:large subunit ribosomal protein L31e